MNKWYYMIKHSWDSSKRIVGPFYSDEDAWDEMYEEAMLEYKMGLACGWDARIIEKKECGEITTKTFFTEDTDITEFFLFKI